MVTSEGLMSDRSFKPRVLIAALLALYILLLALAGCQPAEPKIVITPAEQDLGNVPQKPLDATYTIQNSGSQPLKISKVSTSCDCTKATVDSTEVAPGGTTVLRVHMDPALENLYGKIRRDITVETNDPRAPKATAIFRVEIQKP
jgi:hypothetical protein